MKLSQSKRTKSRKYAQRSGLFIVSRIQFRESPAYLGSLNFVPCRVTNPVTPAVTQKWKFDLPVAWVCWCVGTAMLPMGKNCYFPKDQMKFFTYGNIGKQKKCLFWIWIAFCLGSCSRVFIRCTKSLRFIQVTKRYNSFNGGSVYQL